MVLITGATGLVGSHLALHLLEQGETIRAIYRNPDCRDCTRATFKIYGKENLYDSITWVEADLNDVPALSPAFENITEVYHCAALISFNRKDEEKLRKINIEGTANIVNLSLDFKVRKLCFVSSIAALGDPKENEIIDEETQWNPEKQHSDYAITKHGAEMEIWRGMQEGLEVVIVNPGVILGPVPNISKNKGSSEIFDSVANDMPFYTNGSSGFVAVSDVVVIMALLMKSNSKSERYILIEDNYSFRSLSNAIADALKVKKPSIYAKPWMTSLAWRLDWLISTLTGMKRKLYKDMATSLHTADLYSNDKIKSELGYEFYPIKKYINEIIALRN